MKKKFFKQNDKVQVLGEASNIYFVSYQQDNTVVMKDGCKAHVDYVRIFVDKKNK